jgi:hypothetical protein
MELVSFIGVPLAPAGAAAAREYLTQIRALEGQLATKRAEVDRWQGRAQDELARRAEQAQQLEHARAELAWVRRRAEDIEVGRCCFPLFDGNIMFLFHVIEVRWLARRDKEVQGEKRTIGFERGRGSWREGGGEEGALRCGGMPGC